MAEDKKEFGILSDLAEIAERVTDIYRGKATIIFELDKNYIKNINLMVSILPIDFLKSMEVNNFFHLKTAS